MMRALRMAATVGAVLAATVGRAVAQAPEARLLAIHDDATRDMVRSFVEAARARGTPTEPLVARALQGVVFKADRKAIEQAMVRLEKNLRRSHDLLGAQATLDEVSAGADALSSGVSEKAILELRQAARHRPITVELGVLTELVAKGVPPKRAAEQVRALMARGATGAQLTELNAAVQQDVALGVSPIAALELRGRGVMSLLPPPISATAAQPRP
ncbi:MAG TPA: hypothetical protein VG916_14390 [Gemmatimonadaceae bacterium]|nr:hypothetical protein [Gemmatimonadaceae bacterium]